MLSPTEYLESVNVKDLLRALNASEQERLLSQVEHFTVNEAERRDEIVLAYFGKSGLDSLVNEVAERLISVLHGHSPTILDVGSGVGTFTLPIMNQVRQSLPAARFFAMDVTPAMLKVLARKSGEITPFVGVAEDIERSLSLARTKLPLPARFDAVISTLALHHCPDVGRVFMSMNDALAPAGTVVVADLCTHPFTEFREEMGDYHLGFDPDEIGALARTYFEEVEVHKIPGISCSSSGRSAELFVLSGVRVTRY